MKAYAPVLTLAAVAVLGGVLLVVNSISNPAAAPAVAASAAAPPAAVPVPEPTVAEPAPEPPAISSQEKAYTGRSSGNEVTVAIAVKDGRAVAYVCDGKKIEAWLEGTLEGDQLSLQGAKDASITGTVDEEKSLGSVTVGTKQWPYAAKGVVAPAGLYEGRGNVDGVAARIGWIVEGPEEGNRVTGSYTDVRGVTDTAPAFNPNAPEETVVDGEKVEVAMIDGAAQVVPDRAGQGGDR